MKLSEEELIAHIEDMECASIKFKKEMNEFLEDAPEYMKDAAYKLFKKAHICLE